MNLPHRARASAYAMFYRLPGRVRRRIVRVFVQKYLVGAVTIIRDSEAPEPGRILLLRQPPADRRGWGLPAGLLKRHEPARTAAARELHEESGVRLEPDELTPMIPNAIVHLRGWVDTVFTASVPASTTPLVVDGGEVLEARWWPLDALPPLTRPTAELLGIYGIGPQADPAARTAEQADPTARTAEQADPTARTTQQADPAETTPVDEAGNGS